MAARPDKGGSGGGGKGSALPTPYKFKKDNTTGKLQLLKDGKTIQEQDETGAWVAMGVSTGTGSIHIGDLHSNGSGGENVVWVNEDSAIAYFPAWAGVARNGSSAFSATMRDHGALTSADPNGAVVNSSSVNYNATFTSPADVAFFYIEIVPAETYTGRVMWKADKNTGKEVAAFYLDITATTGTRLTIPFKYPLWAKSGQTFTVSITKDDGTYLKVRGGTTAPSQPYRRIFTRTFVDNPVAIANYGDTKSSFKTTDHNGWVALDGRAVSTLTATQQAQAAALGITGNLPDALGRTIVGAKASTAFPPKATGGSDTIARSALPNFTLTGDTNDTNTDHTHGVGTLVTTQTGSAHTHTYFQSYVPSTYKYDGTGSSSNTAYRYSTQTASTYSEGEHTHPITGNTGSANSNTQHKHPYTTPSINGNVTQTKHFAPYLALNMFVFLGA